MSNYTPDTVHDLIERHIETAQKNIISNLGGKSGAIFLDLCGFFQKHYYQEARKVNPTQFETATSVAVSGETELSITDLQKIVKVCESNADNAITETRLGMTGRGSQSDGWWWDSKNSKIMFTGSLSDTYFVVYLPTYAKPTATDSDLLCPENNDEFIVVYFDRLIELWNFKGAGVNRIQLTDAILQNAMARLLEDSVPVDTDGLSTNSAFF